MKKSRKRTFLLIGIPVLVLALAVGGYAYARSCVCDTSCGSDCADDEVCSSNCADDEAYSSNAGLLGLFANRGESHTNKCPNGLLGSIWSTGRSSSYDR